MGADAEEGIRGFVVPTSTPGFTATKIERKLSLRASVTAELSFDGLRLPGDAVFPEVRGLKGPLSCLNEARYGILWGAVGAARACYAEALEYSLQRSQFGKPLAAFQLTQKKLAEMVIAVNNASLAAVQIGRLKDAGELAPAQVSYGKLANVRAAVDVARTARTMLGGAGITLDHTIMRHMNNLETVLTYEGTEEMHMLSVGAEVTGSARSADQPGLSPPRAVLVGDVPVEPVPERNIARLVRPRASLNVGSPSRPGGRDATGSQCV